MSSLLRRRPSPSMVVAFIALLVAMGGTGYAAILLPANSVGAKQIKKSSVKSAKLANNAVTSAKIASNAVVSSKVKDGSLLKNDFAAGQLPAGAQGPKGDIGAAGPAGAKGDKGDTGAAGSALAFARVAGDGTLDAANSKGVTVDGHPGAGLYCLVVPAGSKNIVGSIDPGSGSASPGDTIFPTIGSALVGAVCAPPANAAVFVEDPANAANDSGFYISIN